jgi:hypothetical protein
MHQERSMSTSGGDAQAGFLGVLRSAALISVLVGAVGSAGLVLREGQRTPRFLLVLFVLWVLSPFMGVGLAHVASKRWLVPARATLHGVTLVLTLGSLVIYGALAWGLFKAKPAAVFLLVPLASWLLSAIAVSIAALSGRRAIPFPK